MRKEEMRKGKRTGWDSAGEVEPYAALMDEFGQNFARIC